MTTYTKFSLAAKIRLHEKFTSEIFYWRKYPDLRYSLLDHAWMLLFADSELYWSSTRRGLNPPHEYYNSMWRLWQHWATTSNCWQLSNNCEGMVETLATLGYNGQLLATQQQLGADGHRLWQPWATMGNCWQLSNNWGNPGLCCHTKFCDHSYLLLDYLISP